MNVLLVTSWNTVCGIAPEKLAARIRVLPSGCWRWTGTMGTWGYPQFARKGKTYRAHRLVYFAVRGWTQMPLDHLCRRPWCVNPDHLEPVAPGVNTLRGVGPAARNAKKQRCKRGHILRGDNLRTKQGRYGTLRVCRACAKSQARARYLLFKRLHDPKMREVHWQHRKSSKCPGCRAFLEVSRAAA